MTSFEFPSNFRHSAADLYGSLKQGLNKSWANSFYISRITDYSEKLMYSTILLFQLKKIDFLQFLIERRWKSVIFFSNPLLFVVVVVCSCLKYLKPYSKPKTSITYLHTINKTALLMLY